MKTSPPSTTLLELVAEPDSVLAELRARGPVAQLETGPLVVGYHEARAFLQDTSTQPNIQEALELFGVSSGPFYEWLSRSPLNMDGETHRRWRRQVMRAFTPNVVDRLRPAVRAEAERLIAAFADESQCEFVGQFARPLPSLGLCELIGVPLQDRARFGSWADVIGLGFNPMLMAERVSEVDAAIGELLSYCSQLVTLRRNSAEDDLVSRLARAAAEDGADEGQIIDTLAGLVFAGHETTKNQLGWMILLLAERPDQWAAVAQDPSQAAPLIEEVMRLRSAATVVSRSCPQPLTIGEHELPQNSSVLCSLWSANRDERAFPAADRLDAKANDKAAQIGFGHGPHHCLGAALARAELQESLIALSAALPCPTIEPGVEMLPAIGITGPTRLPVSFATRP